MTAMPMQLNRHYFLYRTQSIRRLRTSQMSYKHMLTGLVNQFRSRTRNPDADNEDWAEISRPDEPVRIKQPHLRDDGYRSELSPRPEIAPSNAPTSQDQCKLFCLPAELRTTIYEYVLTVDTDERGMSDPSKDGSSHGYLTILTTCKRLYFEARQIFFSINRLELQPHLAVAQMTGWQLEAITQLAIPAENAGMLLADLGHLQYVPNLRSLLLHRSNGIRFTDTHSWTLLAAQLSSELRKMESLTEVSFSFPEEANLNADEKARLHKLTGIFTQLQEAVVNHRQGSH